MSYVFSGFHHFKTNKKLRGEYCPMNIIQYKCNLLLRKIFIVAQYNFIYENKVRQFTEAKKKTPNLKNNS